ncbi:helix-turn-helix domain-containing protein [Paenibacillus glycanilyticus]|uniref:helix-turn-helix domain-containing protein n=1 Tax=Paenibacillus glycanilyticus TaxID=126569 RepID=UPI00203DD6E7|nr:helix-turn-helix transcriptional regulator [Paenibacillus glycanilyticus]MCM3629405.1 helix-turn-helix domain-containing protein [Paenibacillus glycanilyticus]
MNIGNRIAGLREERKWTQEQTSAKLGISRAALSHYEKNRREPDTETLAKFADLYQVSIDYLVGRTQNTQAALSEDIRTFVDHLELSDEELLERYNLSVDGRKLTAEETKRFIAFVRAERMMN